MNAWGGASALTDAIDMAANAYQRDGGLSGLATGFTDLDQRMGGLQALEKIKGYNPTIPIIIMTAYSSVASAVDALKADLED